MSAIFETRMSALTNLKAAIHSPHRARRLPLAPAGIACRLLLAAAFCFLTLPRLALASDINGAWQRQPTGTLAWLRAVQFIDRGRGWAVGGSGALLSTVDGGKRWTIARRPTEDTLHDVYFTDAAVGWLVCERSIYALETEDEPRSYLLKTVNGGITWTRVEVTKGEVEAVLVRLEFAPGGVRGWAFGEAGVLFATEDGGARWTRQSLPTKHLLLGGALFDAQQGWLVGAGLTALRTVDGGLTWREGGVTPETVGVVAPRTRLRAVSFIDERRGWAVGTGGVVFATSDGGRTWRATPTPTDAELFDVKFFDAAEGWAVGEAGTVIHTTDGGATWRVEPSLTTHTLESLCFADRAHGWAVGFGGTIIAYGPAAPTNPVRPSFRNV
ncbi:MAG: YCF48-related protein [Acidobacteriota bacterium]|nr:YCF48-related protein [Acidobacteriota bacterium]